MQINFEEALYISGYTQDSSSKEKSFNSYDQLFDCGKGYSDPDSNVSPEHYLEGVHKEKNTGEKSLICTKCAKNFSKASNLRRHQQTHSGDKPHGCTNCRKKFSNTGDLRKHSQIHNGDLEIHVNPEYNLGRPYKVKNAGEKTLICTLCAKIFSRVSNLRRHQQTHSGDKPHLCTKCRKRFSNTGDLKKHQRVHNGDKPYICIFCGKLFRDSSTLIGTFSHTQERSHFPVVSV